MHFINLQHGSGSGSGMILDGSGGVSMTTSALKDELFEMLTKKYPNLVTGCATYKEGGKEYFSVKLIREPTKKELEVITKHYKGYAVTTDVTGRASILTQRRSWKFFIALAIFVIVILLILL